MYVMSLFKNIKVLFKSSVKFGVNVKVYLFICLFLGIVTRSMCNKYNVVTKCY